ncbi:DUF58 domain-containing protein [Natrialba sp. PRR66]|uniref:DUF58 domain-containing protein n=1 Tax=Natrialba sp. PRR66 TaxID=3098146 RepID=UPI002B1E5FA5|nr:DUF58 domain-containing protein [Natrialba sp. PRR66]
MRSVSRWHSGVVASLALAAVGTVFGSATLLLAATVPVGYLGYAALSSVPDPTTTISVERDCDPRHPFPGERVDVTLTVRNDSTRPLPDVRIADRVPSEIAVVDGTARTATTLRAGEQTEFTYAVRPRRGTYAFDDAWVRVRSLSGTAVATASIPAAGDDELECTIPVDGLSLRRETLPLAGTVASDSGGAGYEFHSTRDYHQGDPVSRIDWRRYARTGELGTVRYREQEATKIVVVVDGRAVSGVAAARGHPGGTTLAAYAGTVTSAAMLEAAHSVGVVGLGVRGRIPDVYAGPPAYVEPGRGADVSGRIASVCDAVAARDEPTQMRARSDGGEGERARASETSTATADRLETLLPSDAQLVVCTPAVDDGIVDLALALRRHGYRLSVVSPNVTTRAEIGARLAAIRRETRLERLQRGEIPVVDWEPEQPLATTLDRVFGEVRR